jgi:hypothetical protein
MVVHYQYTPFALGAVVASFRLKLAAVATVSSLSFFWLIIETLLILPKIEEVLRGLYTSL